MGEIRQSYRWLIPELVDQGCRVATMDLRGHGDSDATFTSYDDEVLADDILALVAELGGPAVVVGNSMGAAAAVIAAASSRQVRGLALLGPFVRDSGGAFSRFLVRLLFVRPWGPAAFLSYYSRLFSGTKPDDHAAHRERVRENLRRPGHWRAFVRTTRTSHRPAERQLANVTAPSLVVMGARDIDWTDPAAEANWIAEQLGSEVRMLPDVGHYPQAQAPEATAAAISDLVERVGHG